jgi:hypothetical protein
MRTRARRYPNVHPSDLLAMAREANGAAVAAGGRGVLIRDLLIFQLKLVLDGAKGVLVFQLSIGAAVIDFILGRPALFYRVLRFSERFDLWLNLYGAAEAAAEGASEGTAEGSDGLFGASRAGSDSLLGKLEELVKQRVEPHVPAH